MSPHSFEEHHGKCYILRGWLHTIRIHAILLSAYFFLTFLYKPSTFFPLLGFKCSNTHTYCTGIATVMHYPAPHLDLKIRRSMSFKLNKSKNAFTLSLLGSARFTPAVSIWMYLHFIFVLADIWITSHCSLTEGTSPGQLRQRRIRKCFTVRVSRLLLSAWVGCAHTWWLSKWYDN